MATAIILGIVGIIYIIIALAGGWLYFHGGCQ